MADKDVQDELQTLKDDLAKLRSDLSDLISVLRDVGSEKAGEARSSVEGEFEELRERLRKALGDAKEQGKKAADEMEERIAQHPLSSLLAAFGIGFIIAKLTDGGRSESSR